MSNLGRDGEAGARSHAEEGVKEKRKKKRKDEGRLALSSTTSTSTLLPAHLHLFPSSKPTPKPFIQIRALNSGTFGFVELCADRATGQQVAVKFIERGDKVRVEFFRTFFPPEGIETRKNKERKTQNQKT